MKRIVAVILCFAILLCMACAGAEDTGKTTIGSVNVNGNFVLQCGIPEGYKATRIPSLYSPNDLLMVFQSEDPDAPVMQLSIAFDEMYAEVERLNDLTEEDLEVLEQTFVDYDPNVEITYGETGLGTKLLIAQFATESLDFISFFSIYKGYEVEFVLVPSEQAEDKTLTPEQKRLSIQFLTDLDFLPGGAPVAANPRMVAEQKYITNLSDYDPENNTVKAEVLHTVTLDEETVKALQVGSLLTVGEFSEKIDEMRTEDDGVIVINDYIYLENFGGEYHVSMDEKEYLETYVTLTLEIPDGLLVEDEIDQKTGELLDSPKQLSVDEFRTMLASGEFPNFATENVWVAFDENGEMLSVERIYAPWQ